MGRVAVSIPPGINGEHTEYDLREGAWLTASNMRFVEGRAEPIGSWGAVVSTPGTPVAITLAGICRNILQFAQIGNLGTLTAFGTSSKLYIGNNTVATGALEMFDCTPVGFGGTVNGATAIGAFTKPYTNTLSPTIWSLGAYGEILISSPSFQGIYKSTGPAVATVVTNAPVKNNHVLVATTARQIVALGCNEAVSGNYNARCIRFSDPSDITLWMPSATNLAYEYILDDPGGIIAGRMVGQYLFVWTEYSLWLGQYTGDVTNLWRFDRIGQGCGLAGPNAVLVDQQTAWWLSRDGRIFYASPGAPPTAIDSPVIRDMWDNIAHGQVEKVFAAMVGRYGEMWWYYPDKRDSAGANLENSRAIFVNRAGNWSRATIARTAYLDSLYFPYPMAVDTSGAVWFHEWDAGTVAPVWSIESGLQYLDDGQSRNLIRGMWPDFKSQAGNITMTLYGRDEAQASESVLTTQTLTTSTTRADFLTDSRMVRMKFAGTAYARFGKPAFDVVRTSGW